MRVRRVAGWMESGSVAAEERSFEDVEDVGNEIDDGCEHVVRDVVLALCRVRLASSSWRLLDSWLRGESQDDAGEDFNVRGNCLGSGTWKSAQKLITTEVNEDSSVAAVSFFSRFVFPCRRVNPAAAAAAACR